MLIEARDVTKAFGAFKAVDNASVAVEEGEILGLIGPNGAGKSTFFNCLTGDLPVTSGTVVFAGTDVTRLPPEARARLGLARSFQVPLTFEFDVGAGQRHHRRAAAPSQRPRRPRQGARRAASGSGWGRSPMRRPKASARPAASGSRSPARSPRSPRRCCSTRRWPA